MESSALTQWKTVASTALDQIEAAHAAVGGQGPGRRYATLQVNHAYAMLLSSQFQGFCRNLHTEAVDFLATSPTERWARDLLGVLMTRGRKLDRGNPNPGNLGSDFAALGMEFWEQVRRVDGRGDSRKLLLEELNLWRNAIAHQDWSGVGGNPTLQLHKVQKWRRACDGLAKSFDHAVLDHLCTMVGEVPW